MSNEKETPVNWLIRELLNNNYLDEDELADEESPLHLICKIALMASYADEPDTDF